MKTIIRKTREQATETAIEMLCDKLSCNTLEWHTVKNTSCDCECGQTLAVEVKGCNASDEYDSVIVGVCETCGK